MMAWLSFYSSERFNAQAAYIQHCPSNRLKKVVHTGAASTQSFDTTLFDARDRRKETELADGSQWDYLYDDAGQLLDGDRIWSDTSSVDGQSFTYDYDGAGNREETERFGSTRTYTPNALNQIVGLTTPGEWGIMGSAASTATVNVNGDAAARKGDYFFRKVTADNTSAIVAPTATVEATLPSGTSTQERTTVIPQTPGTLAYDDDGNLTSDGLWSYTWDGENRLIGMESLSGVPAAQKRKLEFTYDWRSRRVAKRVSHWVSGAWLLHDQTRTIYNGWILQGEFNDRGEAIRTYGWGLGVDGTLEGAGGVGGLLFEQDHYGELNLAVFCDLNGNVTRMVNAVSGVVVADYEYGPFGEMIRASGEYARLNPIGFSSKYTDWETGLLYYGFRYYQPETGRWLSRDPIGERGGVNLYGFVGNNGVNSWDYLGFLTGFEPIQQRLQKIWDDRFPQPDGGGWPGAIDDLADWLSGHPPATTNYGPNSAETRDMKGSSIADKLRTGFVNKNKNKVCGQWQDYTNVKLKFGPGSFFKDLPNGTAHFVGSGRGDATVQSQATAGCFVTAELKITNITHLKSALYHLIPNSWNNTNTGTSAANWTQTYTWTEEFSCQP